MTKNGSLTQSGNSENPHSRIREIILYIFFGGLTTLVNLITYRSLSYLAGGPAMAISIFVVINVISWTVAVTFAYIVNRVFVFKSSGNPFRELVSFVAARIVTLIAFEIGLSVLMVVILERGFDIPKQTELLNFFGFSISWVDLIKIGVQVCVVIANYLFSKIFIFKKVAVSDTSSEVIDTQKEADSIGASK